MDKIFLLIRKKSFALSKRKLHLKVRRGINNVGNFLMSTTIRPSTKPFIDRQKFPYGFKKSGDFSISEANLLTTYGLTLLSLERGDLDPENAEEMHFVDFTKGKAEASSSIEKAWSKYVHLARGKKHFYTLHSSASNQADYDDSYSDDEFDVA